MKLNLYRILAFIIDFFVINIILLVLSNISLFNSERASIKEEYKIVSEVKTEYDKLSDRLEEMLFDNYIDLSEIYEIRSNYPYFKSAFDKVPVNSEFDAEMKTTIRDNVDNIYKEKYYLYNYDVNKSNRMISIVGIILSIFYFGVLECAFNGRTLGKRIFRLRTVDNDKIKVKIPFYKFILKSLLISEAFFYLLNIIFVTITKADFESFFNLEWYYKANLIVYRIQYVYMVALLLMMIIRIDGRSLHDILLSTRVAMFDKKNKEIKSEPIDESITY